MQFGPLALSDAAGAILAHSVVLPSGVLKKGRILTPDDIETLRRAGRQSVVAARLDASDVHEDRAAQAIASAVCGTGLRAQAPFTGRANLVAIAAGLVRLDAHALSRLNEIDERITIATLRDGERVEAGQMVATIKIIPFAVPTAVLDAAMAVASHTSLSISAFAAKSVGLIVTTLAQTKPSVIEKRMRVISDRVEGLGAKIARTVAVAHDTTSLATAIKDAAEQACDPILIFAASAIVDREDVVPAAVVVAGGRVERLGMPVDPGNLLMFARHGERYVVGIPSCAASPKLNGFDWVLERLMAGLPITGADIANMGVGGLLKEIPSRPQPRSDDVATSEESTTRRAPRIGCILLAAGRSTRMGPHNKLLEDLAGKPVVLHAIDAVYASSVECVVVVTGHQHLALEATLAGRNLTITHNREFASGLASSLRAGIAALPAGLEGVFIALGDMPGITPADYNAMIAAFSPADDRSIIVPTHGGKRGNPVLWGVRFFAEMTALEGDAGAKHLIGIHADHVAEVARDSDAIFLDVDTPEALVRARSASKPFEA